MFELVVNFHPLDTLNAPISILNGTRLGSAVVAPPAYDPMVTAVLSKMVTGPLAAMVGNTVT